MNKYIPGSVPVMLDAVNTGKLKKRRDWFMRKLNKHYAEAIERILNGTTFSKQDLRKHHKKKSKLHKNQKAIDSLFNNELNYIINNKFAFTTNRDADPLIIMGEELESVYCLLYTQSNQDENSITQSMQDTFENTDKFEYELHFKRNYTTDPKFNGGWVIRDNSIYGPQLNLMAGGFVDCGSYRHLDMVDCLLTRNEFVVSAPAVRGLGKGSYQLGCQILQLLMAYWIKQGKAYAHKR